MSRAWIDLGHGVELAYHSCTHVPKGQHSGAFLRYDCGMHGGLSWCDDCAGPTWDLVDGDPLTVTPSVRTSGHGGRTRHGFITGGRWVPCGDDQAGAVRG